MTNHESIVKQLAAGAKAATFKLAQASSEQKNQVLYAIVENIKSSRQAILEANKKDLEAAEKKGLEAPLLERLSLENRLDGIIHDILEVSKLPDPVGAVFDEQVLPNQLHLSKQRTPIGVLGVIYESRPNVTLDIGVLAIKSGNCALLRGGSEALNTNKVLTHQIQKALEAQGLPKEAVELIPLSDRNLVLEMLRLHDMIDLIIPRGSAELQAFCRDHSTIPVITGGVGICHLFVDESADLTRSLNVVLNAKVQRPTVCNALDTLLVHAAVADRFIKMVVETLGSLGVSFRLDPKAAKLVSSPTCRLATDHDWSTEWLSLVLGIKVVENLDEAIAHIHRYSTFHSDGILTENRHHADQFIREVDSAAVYVNASTRFTDGAQFGLGAEVAISTQKLHARGPMGLKELTTYKWVVKGDYQVRS